MNHCAKQYVTVFEKKPTVKCYNVTGYRPDEPFVTFRLGSIMMLPAVTVTFSMPGRRPTIVFNSAHRRLTRRSTCLRLTDTVAKTYRNCWSMPSRWNAAGLT